MDRLRFASCAVLACFMATVGLASAARAAVDPGVLKTVDALFAAVNAGSAAGLRAAYAPSADIVDEFPPFHWTGSAAADRWSAQFDAVAKQSGITAARVTRGKPLFLDVEGARAYAVVPATFTYVAKGKKQTERAAWTFILVKAGGAWRIASSTWAKTFDSAADSST